MESKINKINMKYYLLFLYTNFLDHEDVEFFCIDILGYSTIIDKVRFVIEDSSKSVIVIFESQSNRRELSEELHNILSIDDIKFYFLFEKDSLYTANLPIQLKEFIFKPSINQTSLKLEYIEETKDELTYEMDLDIILEKIEQHGIDSLTPTEKKFLDDFKK
jgi:hypothetical protein